MSFAKKAVVLIPSPSEKSRLWMQHTFIALSDGFVVEGYPRSVVLVTVLSVKPDIAHDKRCELAGGCHSTILYPSFVRYARSRFESCVQIDKGIANRSFLEKEPLDDAVFESVEAGLLVSPMTPLNIKEIYAQFLGISE